VPQSCQSVGGKGGIRAQNHHFLRQFWLIWPTIQAYSSLFFLTRHYDLLTAAGNGRWTMTPL
jgi:hypothetical protein